MLDLTKPVCNSEKVVNVLSKIYLIMGLGFLITFIVGALIASFPALHAVVLGSSLSVLGAFVFQIVAIFFVMYIIKNVHNKYKSLILALTYVLFTGSFGITIAILLMVYTMSSIISVFFVTCAMFIALSLFGFNTKRDLSPIGKFAFLALIGIIIIMLLNVFVLASTVLQSVISVAVVLVMAGFIVYDTQRIKNNIELYTDDNGGSLILLESINMYLSFINMFISLLQLFGVKK